MTTDPIMAAVTDAVTAGRSGDNTTARTRLVALWSSMGPHGDPLHRCALAHYLADLYDDPAVSLTWDLRAFDAAAALDDDRLARHHAALQVRAFQPSLHLNLADDYRRLGSFAVATEHLTAARDCVDILPEDGYGRTARAGIEHVAAALATGSTARLPTH